MTEKKPEAEVKTPEFTKEELSIIVQLIAQTPVKVVDAPPFQVMLKKAQQMIDVIESE